MIVHILIDIPDPDMPEIKKNNRKRFFLNLCGIKRYIVTEQLALVIH